jgi:hypothetical protein
VKEKVDEPKRAPKNGGTNRKDRPTITTANANTATNGDAKKNQKKKRIAGVSAAVQEVLDTNDTYNFDEVVSAERTLRAQGVTITAKSIVELLQNQQMEALLQKATTNATSVPPRSSPTNAATATTAGSDDSARSLRAPLSRGPPIIGRTGNNASPLPSVASIESTPMTTTPARSGVTPPPTVASASSTSSSDSKRSSNASTRAPTKPQPSSSPSSITTPVIDAVSWQTELASETDALPSIQSLDRKASLWDPQAPDATDLLEFWATQLERSAKVLLILAITYSVSLIMVLTG